MGFGSDFTLTLASALMGAGQSIYVRGTSELLRSSTLTDGHLLAVDSRLDLRCLLCQPTFEPSDDPFIGLDVFSIDEPLPDSDQAGSRAWSMRRGDGDCNRIDIVIDESYWIAVNIDQDRQVVGGTVAGDAQDAARHFRREWDAADRVDLLFFEPDEQSAEEDQTSVAVDTKKYWDDFLAQMLVQPSRLQEMKSRKFEELVAELLHRDGFEVRLTPQTRDGGCDVLATRRFEAINLMFLIECKRYSRSRKVGVEVVRNLYGVVCQRRANAGLIVTTSTFSTPAVTTTRGLGTQMALKDYDGLLAWMQRLRC